MSKPITPDEVIIEATFPEWVWDVFNELIKRAWDGHQAYILFKDARSALHHHAERNSYEHKKQYIDVETAYRAIGWEVVVNNPDYTENYEGHFIFRKKKK